MSTADNIADIILRQGQILGRGAANKGAIYGGMLQSLGQQITALPTYVQNQRMREQEVAMRNQEMGIRQHTLDQAKAQEQAQRILDQAYPQFVSDTGELNSGGLAKHLSESGLGHLVPTVLENAQKYSEAQSRALKARAEAEDAQGEAAKRIGDGMQAMLDGGASLEDVAGFGGFKIKAGVTSGLIPREDGIGMLTQLDPSNPDTVTAMIKRLQAAGAPAKGQPVGAGGLLVNGKVIPPAARPQTAAAPKVPDNAWQAAYTAIVKDPMHPTVDELTQVQAAAAKSTEPKDEPTVTVRTVDKNGKPVERVMTRSQALQEGSFPSQPRAVQGGAGGAGTPNLTPEAIEDTATRYRILGTGAIPTRIEAPERVRIMNEAAKQQRALGQTAAMALQKAAAFKADGASLTKMQSMADAAAASETKALAQADLVGQLSNKVNRSQSPLWNDWLLSGKKTVLGDKDTTLLFNALDTFTSEYAKIISGSTGSVAGASDSATKKAEGLISAALNKGTLQATIDQMKWEMGQTIKGYGATIEHINDRLQTGAGGAPPAPAAAPAAPGVTTKTYADYLRSRQK